MADEAAGSITQFFGQLRAGDALAARKLWDHFFPRLLGLARKTLGRLPQRAADADDAVQSAFASFWQHVGRGEFAVLDRDDLWNLLGLITVRKSLKQARRERAERRGGGRVLDEAALAGLRLDELVGQTPAHEFDLHCEELLLQLGDELRAFAVLRLMGCRNREIAAQLGCTERKVERKLHLVRLQWERLWPAE